MPLTARYAAAQQVALKAGELARDLFAKRDSLIVENKGAQNFVSRADRAIEDFIASKLAAAFPDDAFLGEESAASFRRLARARLGRRSDRRHAQFPARLALLLRLDRVRRRRGRPSSASSTIPSTTRCSMRGEAKAPGGATAGTRGGSRSAMRDAQGCAGRDRTPRPLRRAALPCAAARADGCRSGDAQSRRRARCSSRMSPPAGSTALSSCR